MGGGITNFKLFIGILLLSSLLISSCITIVQAPKDNQPKTQEQKAESFQEKCEINAGISCDEFKVEPNKILIKFTNKLGYRISVGDITSKTCKSNSQEAGSYVDNFKTYVAVLRDCKNGNVGDKFSETLSIPYWFEVGSKSESGTATAIANAKIVNYGTIPAQEYSHSIVETFRDSVEGTLLENQKNTYAVSGKDYEVLLKFIDVDEAQFTVNGQLTRKMKVGDTDKLADGTSIDVTGVLYQDYAGGIHSATFFIRKNTQSMQPTQIKREYTHKINVIEPKISYDCSRLDVQSASDETVARCNAYNYCDKMTAYDITVRKSGTDAISQHLNQPYSTSQIIDIYAWAKNNIAYQNVPLDDFAPYRPSETITLKSGDCKNYGAVISSMILSIGGQARIVVVPKCIHAFAEVFIGGQKELDSLTQEIKQRYQQDIELNVIKDSQGYWLILDGAGANYPGTTEIKECLDPNAERYYSYSCVSADGKISKQTYKKEYLSQTVTYLCDTCKSINDCEPECKVVCIKAGWVGDKSASGYEVPKYLGLKTEVYCTCTYYK